MVLGIRQIKGESNFSVCLCLSCDLWSKSDMYGPIVQRQPVAATLNVFRRNQPNRLDKHALTIYLLRFNLCPDFFIFDLFFTAYL